MQSLEEYITALKSHYNQDGVLLPAKTTVKSRTVISETKSSGENRRNILGGKSPNTRSHFWTSNTAVSKGKSRKKQKKKSDDFLFYLSLISIVGFSAVLVIKIVKRL